MKQIPTFFLLVALILCSTVALAQPANDDCANATDITADLNTGTCTMYTASSATDDIEPSCNNFFCNGGPNANPNENVWFSFTAPYDGTVRIIVNGYTWGTPNYDPIIGLFSACLPSTEIDCDNVDGDGINNDSINTVLVGSLVSGTTYYISIDPPCDHTGSFCLQVDFFDPLHCTNGMMDGDETGIDCGGADCFACHCFNLIQDSTETGVDCGGADCQVCMTCNDNETCGTATLLTFSGNPLQACITDCNTGASTESWNFTGGCPSTTNTETVYYTFTTTSPLIDITITSLDISDPQLVLLDGACVFWYQCVVGTGGTASITNYFAGSGSTWTLMITTQSGDTGTFTLCIDNYADPSVCNIGDTLTAAPPPDTSGGNLGGVYAPGTTVQFCYTINLYKQLTCQYLHGIVPSWGDCWDDSSFVEITPPVSADGEGNWEWHHADTTYAVIYNQTGDTVNKQGGWFYLNDCKPCPSHNGDPNLAWGDGCDHPTTGPGQNNCYCDDVNGHGYTWNVCFELTTKSDCVPNGDCSVSIKTWTDGQTGPYQDIGCELDPSTFPAIPSPVESCPTCDIFNITLTSVLCYGDSSGTAVATMDTNGTRPYTYSWNSTPAQTDSAATGLPSGTYTLNVIDAIGCTDSSSVTITEPPELLTAITSSTMVLCFGDSTGAATVSTSGGVTPYTFLWDDGSAQTDSTATGLVAGIYKVIVTDSNGCMDSATVVIAEPIAPLSATITASTNLVCNGVATGDITVTGAGGTLAYTYLWDDPLPQTNAMATGLLAGLYQVIITDANACSDSDTITLTEPPELTLVISASSDANCGSSNGMATVTPSGGTGAYTYSWDDVGAQTDSVANGLSAASYQVVVTDANGCQDSISHNVNNLGGGTANITDSTQVLCNGDSTGSLTVTPVGGTAPFTYLWDDPLAQTDSILDSIPSGTYTATVTDGGGCIYLATSTITEPTSINLGISGIVNVACNGDSTGSATVNASGGVGPYTYQWDDPSLQTDSVANGIPVGTFRVIVVDNNGCSDSVGASISEPTALGVSITGSAMVGCNGGSTGSATATPTGGTSPYTYLWDDPSNQTDSVADMVPAGTYKVVITDANGCMDSITTIISEPAVLSLTTVADSTSCGGYFDGKATVAAAGGTANFNYVWSSGDSTINTAALIDSTTGLSAGTYYVTVTDNNGCSAVDSTAVEEPVDITVGVSQDSAVGCNGDSTGVATAVLSFGIAPYNYMWSNGDTLLGGTDTSNTVSGLAAGTYTIQVSDASGCISSDSVVITEPSAIALTMTINNHVSCNGLSDGSAKVNTKNTGTSPWDYVWSNGDSTIASSSNTNDVFALSAGTYYVTVTDANGCSAMDTAIVTEPTLLTVTTTSIDAACGASDGSATATPSGGTGQYTYMWDDPGTQTTNTAVGLAANSYTVVVTDSNGCADSAVVNISNIGGASIAVDSVVDLTCNGDSSGSISITVTGGSTPLTYLWSDSAATEDRTGLDAGSYSVTVTDNAGCVVILDTLITEPTALVITTSSTDISCFGADDGNATATVTGGASPYAYLWGDLLAQTSMSALGLAAGTFTVIVTDTAGCTATDSVTITEPAAIVVTASATDNCLGETSATATATATGGSGSLTYSWDTNPVQTNATATGLASGNYTVTIVDGSGCIETASATVNSIVLPTIFAGADETIALGSSVPLSVTGGLFYNWTPSSGLSCTSCQNTVAAPTITTEYIVFGTDSNDCSNSDTVNVFVDDKISLYLPDVFSPNGDGENDHVFVQGLGIKAVEKFIIYDRWGLKVFENTEFPVVADMEVNKLQGWDGRYKGALLNPGVFVYYVKVIFVDDSSQEEIGDFTLVH